MPSPLIHSLAGIALSRGAKPRATTLERALLVGSLVFAANAPDLDFIPGILVGQPGLYHHRAAHSLAAAFAFGVAAGLLARRFRGLETRSFGVLMGLAYASHLFLDMLSLDTLATGESMRHGVPLFWPVDDESRSFPIAIFLDIKRDDTAGGFLRSLILKENVYSVGLEVVYVALLATVILLRRRVLRDRTRPEPGRAPSSGSTVPAPHQDP